MHKYGGHTWKIAERQRSKNMRAPLAQENPADSADHGKQQAFDDQLADERSAACTQRRSDGDLFLSAERPRQKQTGHVRTGDQQYEAYCTHQNKESRTKV